MKIEVLADADAVAQRGRRVHRRGGAGGRGRARALRHGGERRPHAVADAARPRGRRRAVGERARGRRWMSAWRPAGDPGPEPHASAREPARRMPRCAPSRSTPCRSRRRDLEAAAARYARELERSPARRPCSISPIWGSGPTATPPRSCPAIRCSTSRTADVALTDGLSGPAPDDADLSHARPLPPHPVGGDGE